MQQGRCGGELFSLWSGGDLETTSEPTRRDTLVNFH